MQHHSSESTLAETLVRKARMCLQPLNHVGRTTVCPRCVFKSRPACLKRGHGCHIYGLDGIASKNVFGNTDMPGSTHGGHRDGCPIQCGALMCRVCRHTHKHHHSDLTSIHSPRASPYTYPTLAINTTMHDVSSQPDLLFHRPTSRDTSVTAVIQS